MPTPKPSNHILGLAAVIASADPEDFTPRAWQKALEQAKAMEGIPARTRAERPTMGLHIRDAQVQIRILLQEGKKINRW